MARPAGPGGQLCWGRAGWGAGFVKGCVCLGLAGRHMKARSEENLQHICEGERRQHGVGWRLGDQESPADPFVPPALSWPWEERAGTGPGRRGGDAWGLRRCGRLISALVLPLSAFQPLQQRTRSSIRSLVVQTIPILRAPRTKSPSRANRGTLPSRIRSLWERWQRALAGSCICCWSSAPSTGAT